MFYGALNKPDYDYDFIWYSRVRHIISVLSTHWIVLPCASFCHLTQVTNLTGARPSLHDHVSIGTRDPDSQTQIA